MCSYGFLELTQKMMGKGGERGYGEEKFLRFYKHNRQCRNREMFDRNIEELEMSASAFPMARGVSVYSQALKVLSLSLPLVEGDAGASHSIVSVHSHENKQKNRLKKLQMSGSTQRTKMQKNWSCDISNTQVWSYVDDYFREVTSDDIQMLLPSTNLKGALDFQDECLLVPPLGRLGLSEDSEEAAKDTLISGAKRKLSTGQDTKKRKKHSNYDSGVVITIISPAENNDSELCHVCYGGESEEDNQILFCDHCNVAVHQECYGVKVVPERQWLCSWCRCCSSASRKSNRMQDNSLIDDRLNMSQSYNHSWHCLLCPSKGGALKPIAMMDDDLAHLKPEGSRFAHVFCCQWIPEIYIQNPESMEPIRNIGAVREERWKLLCSICRVKHGACIQCNNGACATAFHPLCAREARFRMEVHSKKNTDDVDLQAFCQKHSVHNNKTSANRSTQSGTTEVTMQDVLGSPPKSDCCLLKKEEHGEIVVDRHHSTCQKSESEVDHLGGGITSTAGKSLRKLLNRSGSSSDESDSTTETSGAVIGSGVGSAISSSKDTASVEEVETNPAIRDLKEHLKKAMERLQITKTDLAVQIGVSSDAIFSWLQNKKQIDRKVTEKIEGWLSNLSSGTANDTFDESGQFVKGLCNLLKTFKVSLRKRPKREGKPAFFVGNHLEKGSPMMDKLIMAEHVSVHQKEGYEMENESTQIEASIAATYEMPMHKSTLAEGDEYAACTIDSGYSQKDGASPASVCLDSDCVSNSERRQRGLSGEASTSYAFTKFAGEEPHKARKLFNSGLEKKQEIEGCATSFYPGTLPSKNAGNICNRVKEEYSTEDISTATGLQISRQFNSAKRDMVTCENLLLPEQFANDTFCAPGFEIAPSAAPASGLVMMDERQSGYCEELKSVLASGPKTCLKGTINPSIHRLIQKQLIQEAEDLVHVGKGAEQDLGNSVEAQWKQLEKARWGGLLEDLPSDEVEEEIVGLQSSLITHARRNQQRCEKLILNVITNVWEEGQVLRKRKEDLLLVDKYLKEVMEAKKKGRKERRNKEAQADLAVASAAAAASSRLGTSRRGDGSSLIEMKPTLIGESLFIDQNAQSSESGFPILFGTGTICRPSKPNITTVRSGSSSSIPSPLKEMVLRPAHRVPKDEIQTPKSADEDPLCDICLNNGIPPSSKIIVCHECKVAVHADCYGVSRSVLTPWYCEACLEFLQQRQSLASQNHGGHEISRASLKCHLCCRHTGALKRSSSGGWVHTFCAQWVREAIIGKDQSSYVNGLESIPAERFSFSCSICCLQQGASFRCNFGHCHTTFHAMCARDAGLYINIKTKSGGGILYRGYCGKHSSQQKEKEQFKCCGSIDDLNIMMKMRVELERIRLLCERLIKRERLKKGDVFKRVMKKEFWKESETIVEIVRPINTMLRLVDSDLPCLGKVYEGMDRMIESIESSGIPIDRVEQLRERYIFRWNQIHSPLACAAYVLDPEFQGRRQERDKEVMTGWEKVLDKQVPIELHRKREVLNCTRDCYNAHMKAIALLAFRLSYHDRSSPGISESLGGERVKSEYIERDRLVEDDGSLRPVSDSMIQAPQWFGIDNKQDESVMTQSKDPHVLFGSKAERTSFPDNGLPQQEKTRNKRHRQQSETLQTEVVMTPTEASVQNKKLPKGYAYVPVGFFMEGKLPDSATQRPDIL